MSNPDPPKPDLHGRADPWPLIRELCEAIDAQLHAGPTVKALVDIRRQLGDLVPGVPPMPRIEQVSPLRGALAAALPCPGPHLEVPLPPLAQHLRDSDTPPRPFAELAPSGLLWLINASVFHPRGHALALVADRHAGQPAAGWTLLGDGSEPWRYDVDCDDRFAAAQATLAEAARPL